MNLCLSSYGTWPNRGLLERSILRVSVFECFSQGKMRKKYDANSRASCSNMTYSKENERKIRTNHNKIHHRVVRTLNNYTCSHDQSTQHCQNKHKYREQTKNPYRTISKRWVQRPHERSHYTCTQTQKNLLFWVSQSEGPKQCKCKLSETFESAIIIIIIIIIIPTKNTAANINTQILQTKKKMHTTTTNKSQQHILNKEEIEEKLGS